VSLALSIQEVNLEKSLAEKESFYEHVVEWGQYYSRIGARPGGRRGQASSCGHDERECTRSGSILERDFCPVGTAQEEKKGGKALEERKTFPEDAGVIDRPTKNDVFPYPGRGDGPTFESPFES
jgi:hypothetical protein